MNPFAEAIDVLSKCASLQPAIAASGLALVECLAGGGKILSCGNGGSGADALHLAQELLGRYRAARVALPALCLNADATTLTCIGNDYGFDEVFARQVTALARPGDILVGFTTSGNSANVLAAFVAARKAGAKTVLLTGKDGGRALGTCDFELVVPSANTARIQEAHTVMIHSWLEQIECRFLPDPAG